MAVLGMGGVSPETQKHLRQLWTQMQQSRGAPGAGRGGEKGSEGSPQPPQIGLGRKAHPIPKRGGGTAGGAAEGVWAGRVILI